MPHTRIVRDNVPPAAGEPARASKWAPRRDELIEPLRMASFFDRETAAASGDVDIGVPKHAIFVAHGMGQQIKHEAIEMTVNGIYNACDAGDFATVLAEARGRTVMIGDTTLQRAEIELELRSDGRRVDLHIYEGYWAPFTEGNVTLRDVMSFLVLGARAGLTRSWYAVQRWIFGRFISMERAPRTFLHFGITAAMIASLFVLNGVIAATATGRLVANETWPDDELFRALTGIGLIVTGATFIFGLALLSLVQWARRERVGWFYRRASNVAMSTFWLWCGSVIFASFAFLAVIAWQFYYPQSFSDLASSLPPVLENALLVLLVWASLIAMTYFGRRLLVRYPGDVAAYVNTNSLDKFTEVREKIRACVLGAMKAVYGARIGSTPYYTSIGVIGHSLGSVVAYDALNALFVLDAADGAPARMIDRTKVLVTFGSPLDKTAFIFGAQGRNTERVREQLVAATKPLIQDYERYRNFTWVNVYSPLDIVSGELNYYDCADAKGYAVERAIENIVDPDVRVPLIAHVEYWRNPVVFARLLRGLLDADDSNSARRDNAATSAHGTIQHTNLPAPHGAGAVGEGTTT